MINLLKGIGQLLLGRKKAKENPPPEYHRPSTLQRNVLKTNIGYKSSTGKYDGKRYSGNIDEQNFGMLIPLNGMNNNSTVDGTPSDNTNNNDSFSGFGGGDSNGAGSSGSWGNDSGSSSYDSGSDSSCDSGNSSSD